MKAYGVKIYGVVPKVGGPTHIVIAKKPTEAIVATVNYLNQFQTGHLYKASDFYFSDITDYIVSRPVVIS